MHTQPSSAEIGERNSVVGLRVLAVEDEPILLMVLEDILNELGCTVVGLANDVTDALQLIDRTSCDVAILDTLVRGSPIGPVADVLRERSVPIVFATGYCPHEVRAKFGNHPIVQKPYQVESIRSALLGV